MVAAPDAIRLRGVRQNNLKALDLDIPLGRLTVVTGLSGAGKSSLVFETLHAEGQRRYVETFSPYTRQFLELLDRPSVGAVENIRPSIAIQQSNTVRSSRSSVGTITELCDYFKVWFAHLASLHDPATGRPLRDDNPQSIWRTLLKSDRGRTVLPAFPMRRPGKLTWDEILGPLRAQGYTRCARRGRLLRLEELDAAALDPDEELAVVQDRLEVAPPRRARFLEAARHALGFAHGSILILDTGGGTLHRFSEGLSSPETGRVFRPASPALFSFNSPIGACPRCRGFGRIIEIDDRLVIPDDRLSLDAGAIRAFQGEVYSESLRDLRRAARRASLRMDVPWRELEDSERDFVLRGDPDYEEGNGRWYGVRRFFAWLESRVYKMHVRVFLSKFRSYTRCPDCGGARLREEAMNWKWRGRTLPDLYRMSVSELLALLRRARIPGKARAPRAAHEAILARLGYLERVGLGYLTLDRPSRTLSGGETMRVNLTTCLGSALVDTLFVLDEPSVGLHPRDMDRLIAILRDLTDRGNTVVVVEHDEAVMRAADHLVEIGPEPGANGGRLTFSGSFPRILSSDTITGRFLSGRESIPPANGHPPEPGVPLLSVYGATKHNLRNLDLHLPQRRMVCLSGISGSGKSTLLDNVIHQNLLRMKGRPADDPAEVRDIESGLPLSEVVLVDQSPASRTPRSNPAVFSGAWDEIRKLFAGLDGARQAGLTAGHFSFNSGDGRCPHCSGLGYERIEMQFVSDLFVRCPVCEGRRFRPVVLDVTFQGHSVASILDMDTSEAADFFAAHPRIVRHLRPLLEVGLGYLALGQPLNTLSGGESQRLKLVRYLGNVAEKSGHTLILVDEPTTGLHRADVKRLIGVLRRLVEAGNSLVIIEHNLDVLKSADWIVEMGPGAGSEGGRIVAEGTPRTIAHAPCETAPYLKAALEENSAATAGLLAAEPAGKYEAGESEPRNAGTPEPRNSLRVTGAREHNLKDVSVEIPHNALSVVTGVSGSGKSSLAFDTIFAEGQRRFMESMSAYARQFVEQMPRAEVDAIEGIAPAVAIEQRVTRGTRKSTVATITEVAQYLRLLYARIGVQHSPSSGEPVAAQDRDALLRRLRALLPRKSADALRLCAQLVRGRKGHHQPLADWAGAHGYETLRVDGRIVPVAHFQKLDRYREHDIDLVVAEPGPGSPAAELGEALDTALRLGKGTAFVLDRRGAVLSWLSTRRTDPVSGEAFPEPDPKHFSWNSPRGWCPNCRGYGRLYEGLNLEEASFDLPDDGDDGALCPECRGARLNPVSCAVKLLFRRGGALSFPELLSLTPSALLAALGRVKTDARGRAVLDELFPEIEERLRFMDRVGLGYLSLDRPTATLSGGEAQRIRLAAQLGSNLAGVLYVLDEPSIGLHASDNEKLIASLERLRDRGNTLLVVEHDEATMARANRVIDLGPGAGLHGGEVIACGTLKQLRRNKKSLTGHYLRKGIRHPSRGEFRQVPPWSKNGPNPGWVVLQGAALRNLRGFDLRLPQNRLCVLCGVSGAGKSTLARDLLKPLVEAAIEKNVQRSTSDVQRSKLDVQRSTFRSLRNGNQFRKVIEVDQSPIGKTPRSTPATYIGAFDIIRQVFASLPEARFRGYDPGTFSFNTAGGRCETCKGAGRIKLEMNFMPDTYVDCEDCGGSRYGAELADLRWNGQSIADVLAMSFEQAAAFFHFHSRLHALLALMVETGLGYLTLGQNSPSLSGGEAQRLKLVSELARGLPTFKERQYGAGGGNLYLLEEPTIGLHASDCERLLGLLHRLVDDGHTVLVIEHHLDIIRDADYLVELGPGGGEAGGRLLYQGDLAGLQKSKQSVTARYL